MRASDIENVPRRGSRIELMAPRRSRGAINSVRDPRQNIRDPSPSGKTGLSP
jgi:hypothetical protein